MQEDGQAHEHEAHAAGDDVGLEPLDIGGEVLRFVRHALTLSPPRAQRQRASLLRTDFCRALKMLYKEATLQKQQRVSVIQSTNPNLNEEEMPKNDC